MSPLGLSVVINPLTILSTSKLRNFNNFFPYSCSSNILGMILCPFFYIKRRKSPAVYCSRRKQMKHDPTRSRVSESICDAIRSPFFQNCEAYSNTLHQISTSNFFNSKSNIQFTKGKKSTNITNFLRSTTIHSPYLATGESSSRFTPDYTRSKIVILTEIHSVIEGVRSSTFSGRII